MTRLQDRGINLNTLLIAISILGAIITSVLFIAPLKTLPDAVENMGHDMQDMRRTQAVQTEALKTLADVARDSRETRRDVDRLDASLDAAVKRLDRLEARP